MSRASRWLLAALALVCVALQLGGELGPSALSLGLWLGASALLAPGSLRRLWLPGFWGLSLALALGSGLLLGPRDLDLGPLRLSRSGLEAGALMLLRAAFLLALTGWASRVVGSDEVQSALRRAGLASFGGALATAFALLPTLAPRVRAGLQEGRQRRAAGRARRLYDLALALIRHAALLARSLEPGLSPRLVAAVVGPPGSGKTRTVQGVLERLRSGGARVGGVTQPAVHEAGARVGYLLRDAATGEERPFARRSERSFAFAADGWAWARARLDDALGSAQVVVLDELGRLEARGEGHLAAPLDAPALAPQVLLLAVREDQAPAVAARLGPFALQLAAGASAEEVERFARQLHGHLQRPLPTPPETQR